MPKLGPGTLTVGEVGSEIDASCLINNAAIATEKDEGDGKTMLCGTDKPGSVTYTYTLSGNIDTDTDDADGLFALSQTAAGTEQPFTFTPSTEGGTSASGTLVIDPLDFGADEYGEYLNSDFEWTVIGQPDYTYPEAPAVDVFARTVVNGKRQPGVRPAVKTPKMRKEPGAAVKPAEQPAEKVPA